MFFHFQEGVCPVCLEGKGLPCCKGKIMALSLCAYKTGSGEDLLPVVRKPFLRSRNSNNARSPQKFPEMRANFTDVSNLVNCCKACVY